MENDEIKNAEERIAAKVVLCRTERTAATAAEMNGGRGTYELSDGRYFALPASYWRSRFRAHMDIMRICQLVENRIARERHGDEDFADVAPAVAVATVAQPIGHESRTAYEHRRAEIAGRRLFADMAAAKREPTPPKPVADLTPAERLQRAIRLTAEGHDRLLGWPR